MHIINSPIDDIKDPEIELAISSPFIIKSQSIEISWNIEHAVSAEITPYIGAIKLKGSIKLNPDESTTYTLTAKGVLKNTSKTISVSVYPTPVLERLKVPSAPEIHLEANFQLAKMEVPKIFNKKGIEDLNLRFPKIQSIKKEFIPSRPSIDLAVKIFEVTPQQLRDNKIETLSPFGRKMYHFKSQTFNTLQRIFRSNPKITDIIKTIRKHYE